MVPATPCTRRVNGEIFRGSTESRHAFGQARIRNGSPTSPLPRRRWRPDSLPGSRSIEPRIEERRRECASGGRKFPARTMSRRSSCVRNAVSRAIRSSSASRSDRRAAYARIDFQSPPSDAGEPDTAPAHSANASIRSSASSTLPGGTRGNAKRGIATGRNGERRRIRPDQPRVDLSGEQGKILRGFEGDRQQVGCVQEFGDGSRRETADGLPAGGGFPEGHDAGGLGRDTRREPDPLQDDLPAERHVTLRRGSPQG